jgi:hypothetical protein
MGDSHNGNGDRFHHEGDIVPLDHNSFFGHPDLSLASYNFWDTPGYHSHNGSNIANGPVQDGNYLQRGFYGSGTSQLQGFMPTTTQSRHSINDMNLGFSSVQQSIHQFGLQSPEMSYDFNGEAASQTTGQYGYIPSQYELQQSSHPPFPQAAVETQEQDNDCESVGSATTDCDSNCDLADPCTDESCAGRDDACTDRHCPEKDCPDTNCPDKMPSEVVVAAATLAAFGVEPPQQHGHEPTHQGKPLL